LKPFDYVAAHSLKEAISLLAQNSPEARPIAGGTDLLVRMKRNLVHPRLLVDLAGVAEFRGIELNEKGLRIGSMVTHAEIMNSPLVRQYGPALAAASASVGAPQTRFLGTIGGNLSSGVPSMDGAPPLLTLEATVTVAHSDGQRVMGLKDFFSGPQCTILTPEQLLMDILIPAENLGKPSGFVKFGRRKALSLSLVNMAACVELDQTGRRFVRVRLAMGAVAPTPMRAYEAETFLEGKEVTEGTLAEAGVIAAREAKPIDDLRASAEYRRDLIRVLTGRVLGEALGRR
jgi:CO/xanthine dehydrogenase FAD-binding subunit